MEIKLYLQLLLFLLALIMVHGKWSFFFFYWFICYNICIQKELCIQGLYKPYFEIP